MTMVNSSNCRQLTADGRQEFGINNSQLTINNLILRQAQENLNGTITMLEKQKYMKNKIQHLTQHLTLNTQNYLGNPLLNSIIFLICFLTLNLSAEQVTPDAYYNSIRHEYILNEDGTIVYNYEHNLKFLSYMSFNRLFGESFVIYNPDFQELNITKSMTKLENGEIIKSPFNAFNQVLPGEAGQAVPYMNLREMVITHTGLERNSEVNFSYTLTTKNGFYPGLIGKIVIGTHEPVKYFEIVLKVPKDTKINLYMSNKGPVGDKITKDNFDYYIWKIYDLPLIPKESHQPALEFYMPTLYFSTASNSDIVKHLSVDNENIFQLSNNSKKLCKEIIKNQFSFRDKVFALRNYIFQNVGQTNIDLSCLGWKTQSAMKTYENNVGSKADRAVLLAAMCREAGINADLAITTNYSNAKPDMTLLSQFNEYLVYCTPENEKDLPILIDPNNNQTSLIPKSAQKKPIFVLNSKKIFLIPAVDESGSLSFSTNLKINKQDTGQEQGLPIEGQAKMRLSGNYIPDFDYEKSNTTVKNSLSNTGWTTEDKEKNTSIGNEFDRNISLKRNIEKKYEDIFEMELPLPLSKIKNIEIIPTSRVTPYSLPSQIDEEYNFTIELPEGLKSIFNPEEINISNPVGEVESSVKFENNQIIINRKIKIDKQWISPEEYHHLYKLISSWRNKYHNTIYLK